MTQMPEPVSNADESLQVKERYARRDHGVDALRYSLFEPYALAAHQERQRVLLRLLTQAGTQSLAGLDVLDVGCGSGGHLLDLIRVGADPHRMQGIELLEERVRAARSLLPVASRVWWADALAPALQESISPASQDIVMQFTVFSSILSGEVQQALAARMWQWLRPGGCVVWHDFVYNNPRNQDVRGVPVARMRALFPEGAMQMRRITLAPPLGRRACRISPVLYPLLNSMPWLRTHVLCLIHKSD